MHTRNKSLLSLAIALTLVGCSQTPEEEYPQDVNDSRYEIANDRIPTSSPDIRYIENPVPRYEPYSLQGNKAYQVNGQHYQVLTSHKGYSARGLASWYGEKFHGHLTSNGERYDMYSLSAAHKSLPLPVYVRVTNQGNGKSVIVRVNDRGPFHSDREIDLSYAAAAKLDMLDTGVANVIIEAIHVPSPYDTATMPATPAPVQPTGQPSVQPPVPTTAPSTPSVQAPVINPSYVHNQLPVDNPFYVQLMASKDQAKLATFAQQLSNKYQIPARLQFQGELYRLQMGPINRQERAQQLVQQLVTDGFPNSYILQQK